jgi:GTP 3',8-cyclase
MLDSYNRSITYLRISVSDRCNLRCIYCMPAKGIHLLKHEEIITYEDIVAVVKEAVKTGINKVRLTGGEPLVRKGIVNLVAMLSEIHEIQDLSMTTNGILLEKYAQDLARQGLHRVNISLDTLNPDRYREITRGGNIHMVFRGIEAAQKAGLTPVKLNCVILNDRSIKEAEAVKEFGLANNIEVRFIHQMHLDTGDFHKVIGGSGGDCKNCNRLRLTAHGKIKPCLFSDLEFDIHEQGIKKALPSCGTVNHINMFHNIGG